MLSRHAVDVEDALGVAQRGHKLAQLLGIRNGEGKAHRGDVVITAIGAHGQHVELLLAEHAGQLSQQALAVDGLELDARSKLAGGALAGGPLHLHHALWFLLELFGIGAICTVNRNAAATGDESEDGVARHGLAAARQLSHDVGATPVSYTHL